MHEFTTRRSFLSKAVGVACGVSLVDILAPKAEAQVGPILADAALWLGKNVLVPAALTAFGKWLDSSRIFRKPEDGSFHDHYNPGIAFDAPFRPQPTRWNGYLGVQGLPTLSTSASSPREGELNLAEIGELRNDNNPNLYYGGMLRLAPIPNSLRSRPSQQDVDIMAYDLMRFGMNPAYFQVQYARQFCDCSGARLRGYGWSSVQGDQGFRIVQV